MEFAKVATGDIAISQNRHATFGDPLSMAPVLGYSSFDSFCYVETLKKALPSKMSHLDILVSRR